MENEVQVNAFYRFVPIPKARLLEYQQVLSEVGAAEGVRGLVILAEEGVNATISGSPVGCRNFIERVCSVLGTEPLSPKQSQCAKQPFRRLQIQLRDELITLDAKSFFPTAEDDESHLSPAEWHRWLSSGSPCTLLDVRNSYEARIGTFSGAVDPGIKVFSEFPAYVEQSGLSREVPVLMFCTGGIRCEKAARVMREKGFREVYQLDGGILKYLEDYPEGFFKGECFVFDHRVAVTHTLRPSQKYRFCPHCGDPAGEPLRCTECGASAVICSDCQKLPEKLTCSKNCSYHARQRDLGRGGAGAPLDSEGPFLS